MVQQCVYKCPSCGELGKMTRYGFRYKAGGIRVQQWMCKGKNCYRITCDPIIISMEDK
jgi:hypothetical protein